MFKVKHPVDTTPALKFYIRLWIHDHAELTDLKTFMYGIKMAEKSCDLLYVAELILSEESVRKLPLNNAIKHINSNLEARYFKCSFLYSYIFIRILSMMFIFIGVILLLTINIICIFLFITN